MTSEQRYYIGIDVGTQSVRGGLVTPDGFVKTTSSCPIKIWNPQPDHYEQSSEEIWAACVKVIKEITKGVDKRLIYGIGFDATCSFVALDKDFKPLSVSTTGIPEQNIMLWMDHRAVAEADFITSLSNPVLKSVGGKMSPEMEPSKLLWFKKNLPSSWEKSGHFFDLPDFLTWKATGSLQRSLCSLVAKWTYQAGHAANQGWQDDFWCKIGLGDLICDNYKKIGTSVLVPGESCGNGLTEVAASEMGLLPGTPVSASIIDAHAGGLGILLCNSSENEKIEDRMALICGTSTCHMKLSKELIFTPGVWGPYFSIMVPNYWCAEAGQSAAGALLDHVINCHPASESFKMQIVNNKKYRHITDLLNEKAEELSLKQGLSSVSLLTNDYHVWPDYHGNRSPLAKPNLKGMICGLTLSPSEEDLIKQYIATIQALAYSTNHIIKTLEENGHMVKTLLVCGGLSKNSVYIQMHADITGLPIIIPNNSEPVLVGGAILGASAAKHFPSVISAMAAMSGAGKLVEPCIVDRNYHKKKYEAFLRLLKCQEDVYEIMK